MLKSDTKIYFVGLTGSKLLNTNIQKSDVDYIVLTNNPNDVIRQSKPYYVDLICNWSNAFWYQVFTSEYDTIAANGWSIIGNLCSPAIINTPLSIYLDNNVETLIQSNLPHFGKIILNYVNYIVDNLDFNKWGEEKTKKRIMYALIFMNAYIRYATEAEIEFRQAFRPLPSDLQKFIVDMRNGNIPKSIYLEKLYNTLDKANAIKSFYDKAQPDLETFNKIKLDIKNLLEI